MSDLSPVSSPCIGVCRIEAAAGVCAGCYRTRAEIAAWPEMRDERRRQLLLVLEQRQAESVDFD